MLTGKPPLGHLEPHAAMFSIGNGEPLNLTLPESVSNEAKRFIKAALTWLVLFKLFSYRMDVKKLCFKACDNRNAGVTERELVKGQ